MDDLDMDEGGVNGLEFPHSLAWPSSSASPPPPSCLQPSSNIELPPALPPASSSHSLAQSSPLNSSPKKDVVQVSRKVQKAREKSHALRKRKRKANQDKASGGYDIRPSILKKYVLAAPTIPSHFQAEGACVASSGFIGLDDGTANKKTYRLEELVGPASTYGFKLYQWDGMLAIFHIPLCL
jgi:hypothetical protein